MHTSKTISHTTLTLVASLSLVFGFTVALNWTAEAQEPPAMNGVNGVNSPHSTLDMMEL